jgi:hypothetical protein
MKQNIIRSIGGAVLIASVLLGSAACSSGPSAAPAATATEDASKKSPAEVSGAIKSYFAAATSKEIGAAFPDKATEDTFAPVLDKIDPAAPAAPLKKAVTDLALLKVSAPDAALDVTVDESKITVDGQTATLPVSALSVTSGGTPVANSDALAAGFNNLVFRDGSWMIAFPAAPEASASASPSASASESSK